MPALCWAGLLLLSAGCSNGRGNVEDREPQAEEAQQGFSVGGAVSGLTGSGLVLQNNGAGNLGIAAAGAFTFTGLLGNGAAYNVTVLSQPRSPAQVCTVANGSGAVPGQHVTNISVTCATTAFNVGGTVTGLAGSGLTLQNNGADEVAISTNGSFTFSQPVATGSTYEVTISAQPTNPTQTCTVTTGSGAMGDAPVRAVRIECATGQFTVSGAVSGLLGQGLVLQNNGADDVSISANGAFTFVRRLPSGAPYSVTVRTQPSGPAQNCVVRNAAGIVNGRDVANVAVSCATNVFTIGGAVSGVAGTGLRLQLDGANDLRISRGGQFAFEIGLADGAAYRVSVARQPSSPAQTCTIANATGVVAGSNVSNIAVTCATRSFAVGGVVSGLVGTGLALQLNGGGDLSIVSNGRFVFAARLESGAPYRVSVRAQPAGPPQTCTLASSSGTVGDGDVTNVRVTCATGAFAVGGTVNGLMGAGLVLENNGGDPLAIRTNGAFAFARGLASGANYNVSVRTEPSEPAQACTVANASGVIGVTDVANVSVNCTTSEFTIGGRVRGLDSAGLILRNNGRDDVAIDRSGSFTFPTPLPAGASFNITIAAQPATQTCTVENASGVVNGRVTNIEVECAGAPRTFRILVRVEDLEGSGLVLQNNGGDDLAIASEGEFAFATPLPSGATFNVTVARQPVDPAQVCAVDDGSGTVRRSDVDDPEVECEETEED